MMTYSQLVDAIKSYTQNYDSDFVSNIDTFITQAEERIYNIVQLPAQRRNVTGQTTANNKYLALPSDWLSNYSIAVVDNTTGEYEYLLNKDVNFIRQTFPFPLVSGKPKYYAIFDQNTFILGPTPNAVYTMEMHYNAYPASIVAAGTSWLGDNYETVLLYGSLVQAYVFMKGDGDVLQMYQGNFNEALGQIKRLGDGLDRQDAYRSGQVRIQVT